jgi:hypothetical protein
MKFQNHFLADDMTFLSTSVSLVHAVDQIKTKLKDFKSSYFICRHIDQSVYSIAQLHCPRALNCSATPTLISVRSTDGSVKPGFHSRISKALKNLFRCSSAVRTHSETWNKNGKFSATGGAFFLYDANLMRNVTSWRGVYLWRVIISGFTLDFLNMIYIVQPF